VVTLVTMKTLMTVEYSFPPFSMEGPDLIQHEGRWYINMGRPGFNSKPNNGLGYDTMRNAEAAMRYFTNRGQRRI